MLGQNYIRLAEYTHEMNVLLASPGAVLPQLKMPNAPRTSFFSTAEDMSNLVQHMSAPARRRADKRVEEQFG